ncbi:MAG: hypothetical protein ABL952_13025, partial [Pyrinomonadaceae bacterium]
GAAAEKTSNGRRDKHDGQPSLTLLTPLIETAWADGRVSRRELELIAQVADAYKMVRDESGYRELIERLMSRPSQEQVELMWKDLEGFMEAVSIRERKMLKAALAAQAHFIAEYGSDNVLGFIRGDGVSHNEQEALRTIVGNLERAEEAAEDADVRKSVAVQLEKQRLYEAGKRALAEKTETLAADTKRQGMITSFRDAETKSFQKRIKGLKEASDGSAIANEKTKPIAMVDDSDKLIPLVPLVKVAWAEGRITKRERELIFGVAARMGIAEGSPSHERLSGWLEFHPPDDFFLNSLERLNSSWGTLPDEEKNLRRLYVLSDCVNVAEASGGSKRYPAGGRRVCDEEFAAVKSIADKLKPVATATAAPSL